MMLQKASGVQHDFHKLAAQCKLASQLVDQQRHTVLHTLGVRVFSWMAQDYTVKSRGGTDPQGIKWAPIKASTIRARVTRMQGVKKLKTKKAREKRISTLTAKASIGIDTGRLRTSVGFGKSDAVMKIDQASVTVGTGVSYGKYFDAKRAIFPEQLAPQRVKELENLTVKATEKAIAQAIGGGLQGPAVPESP